jgi:hypothetical protein
MSTLVELQARNANLGVTIAMSGTQDERPGHYRAFIRLLRRSASWEVA